MATDLKQVDVTVTWGGVVANGNSVTVSTRNDGTDPTVTLAITAQARTGKPGRQTQFSEVVALRNRDTD